MKKLMIAAAVVCAAVFAQAATYDWKSTTDIVTQPGTEDDPVSGTAYLFNAGTVSQQSLLTALLDGTDIAAAGSIATGTMSAGKVAQTQAFTYDGVTGGTTWDAYMAIVDGDKVFISDTKSVVAPSDQSTTTIAMKDPWEASSAPMKTTDTFAGAGWYQTVPEPTSGLLLLLGVAGLALRRRRA